MFIFEKKDDGTEILYRIQDSCTLLDQDQLIDSKIEKTERDQNQLYAQLITWLKDVFLPQGYPNTVSPDYIHYQFWDSIQAYCSNVAGALSLHATLVGIGVGSESASPIAAAVSWLTKDGTGMISSIAFAYLKGSELDNNCKQWRLFADVANDGANFVKLLAPVLPIPFGVTLCISSVIQSLVGVAGGATRASLVQHQALCNNMADVSAKDGSQETLVNLAGLITSLTLLPYLTSNQVIVWLTFTCCVILHLFSNYKAMRALNMKTLNRGRLLHILKSWTSKLHIPDIYSTNAAEPMLFGPAFLSNYLTNGYNLVMGVSFTDVIRNCSLDSRITMKFYHFSSDNFQLYISEEKQTFYAIFHRNSCNEDFIKCFWTAYVCALNMEDSATGELLISKDSKESANNYLNFVQEETNPLFSTFLQSLKAGGWQLDPLRLNIGGWRYETRDDEEIKKNL